MSLKRFSLLRLLQRLLFFQRILVESIVFLIKGYQYLLSPLLGARCRFYPTCSDYAISSLKKYGFFKGSLLMFWRLLRCHPGCSGGLDPVPECCPVFVMFKRVVLAIKKGTFYFLKK